MSSLEVNNIGTYVLQDFSSLHSSDINSEWHALEKQFERQFNNNCVDYKDLVADLLQYDLDNDDLDASFTEVLQDESSKHDSTDNADVIQADDDEVNYSNNLQSPPSNKAVDLNENYISEGKELSPLSEHIDINIDVDIDNDNESLFSEKASFSPSKSPAKPAAKRGRKKSKKKANDVMRTVITETIFNGSIADIVKTRKRGANKDTDSIISEYSANPELVCNEPTAPKEEEEDDDDDTFKRMSDLLNNGPTVNLTKLNFDEYFTYSPPKIKLSVVNGNKVTLEKKMAKQVGRKSGHKVEMNSKSSVSHTDSTNDCDIKKVTKEKLKKTVKKHKKPNVELSTSLKSKTSESAKNNKSPSISNSSERQDRLHSDINNNSAESSAQPYNSAILVTSEKVSDESCKVKDLTTPPVKKKLRGIEEYKAHKARLSREKKSLQANGTNVPQIPPVFTSTTSMLSHKDVLIHLQKHLDSKQQHTSSQKKVSDHYNIPVQSKQSIVPEIDALVPKQNSNVVESSMVVDEPLAAYSPGQLPLVEDELHVAYSPDQLPLVEDELHDACSPDQLPLVKDEKYAAYSPGQLSLTGDEQHAAYSPGPLSLVVDEHQAAYSPDQLSLSIDEQQAAYSPVPISLENEQHTAYSPDPNFSAENELQIAYSPGPISLVENEQHTTYSPGPISLVENEQQSAYSPNPISLVEKELHIAYSPGQLPLVETGQLTAFSPGPISLIEDKFVESTLCAKTPSFPSFPLSLLFNQSPLDQTTNESSQSPVEITQASRDMHDSNVPSPFVNSCTPEHELPKMEPGEYSSSPIPHSTASTSDEVACSSQPVAQPKSQEKNNSVKKNSNKCFRSRRSYSSSESSGDRSRPKWHYNSRSVSSSSESDSSGSSPIGRKRYSSRYRRDSSNYKGKEQKFWSKTKRNASSSRYSKAIPNKYRQKRSRSRDDRSYSRHSSSSDSDSVHNSYRNSKSRFRRRPSVSPSSRREGRFRYNSKLQKHSPSNGTHTSRHSSRSPHTYASGEHSRYSVSPSRRKRHRRSSKQRSSSRSTISHSGQRDSSSSSRSRSRDRRRYQSSRSSCSSRQQQSSWWEEKQRQIDERRVVYVGVIPDGYSMSDLRERFSCFGQIEDVRIHIRSSRRNDNYGFVTFRDKQDAYRAVECGNDHPLEPKFGISFGGRRRFCKQPYSDPDKVNDVNDCYDAPPPPSQPQSFDNLLKAELQRVKVRGKKS